jgi:glyoxylase-like metal-dependent hydrolase (beta-lactamase superfamily II)
MTAFGPDLPAYAELAPGIRRIVAPNPSMMTGPGTNTYLLGTRRIAVLDPGPAIPRHVDDIIDRAGAEIGWILVTHTHPDHSPAASLLAEKTGAELIGRPPPPGPHQDRHFAPGRVPDDGEEIGLDGTRLQAVHTPGHASNHVCYRHVATNWLFTGDHVIDGSTVVIDPPDGDMKAYIESLRRCLALDCSALAPGHGDVIADPRRAIEWIIAHRLEREAGVVAAVAANPNHTSHELVPFVYRDVNPKLYGWAERSLLAHLKKLEREGRAVADHGRWRLELQPDLA